MTVHLIDTASGYGDHFAWPASLASSPPAIRTMSPNAATGARRLLRRKSLDRQLDLGVKAGRRIIQADLAAQLVRDRALDQA